MKKSLLALIFGAGLVLAACGGGSDESTGDATKPEGEKITMQKCATCHGGNLQGMGNTPALNDVGSRLSEAEILDIIENGTSKGMPGGIVKGDEAKKVAEWLAQQK
jgi:cytochrome c551